VFRGPGCSLTISDKSLSGRERLTCMLDMKKSVSCSSMGTGAVRIELEDPLDVGESSISLIDTLSGAVILKAFVQVASDVSIRALVPASLPTSLSAILITIIAAETLAELKLRQLNAHVRIFHEAGISVTDIVRYDGKNAVISLPPIAKPQSLRLQLIATDSVGFYQCSNSIQMDFHEAPIIKFIVPSVLIVGRSVLLTITGSYPSEKSSLACWINGSQVNPRFRNQSTLICEIYFKLSAGSHPVFGVNSGVVIERYSSTVSVSQAPVLLSFISNVHQSGAAFQIQGEFFSNNVDYLCKIGSFSSSAKWVSDHHIDCVFEHLPPGNISMCLSFFYHSSCASNLLHIQNQFQLTVGNVDPPVVLFGRTTVVTLTFTAEVNDKSQFSVFHVVRFVSTAQAERSKLRFEFSPSDSKTSTLHILKLGSSVPVFVFDIGVMLPSTILQLLLRLGLFLEDHSFLFWAKIFQPAASCIVHSHPQNLLLAACLNLYVCVRHSPN
jgi:hypothetical protein